MIKAVWINSETDVFLNHEGERKYLKDVGVKTADQKTESAELYGYWPMAASLLDIQNGDTIEITRSLCSQRSSFWPDAVIMRLLHCRVRSINFSDLVGLSRHEEPIIISIGLDCDVEIVKEPDDD